MLSIFFRQKRESANSIETVFQAIIPYLYMPHGAMRLPCNGASLHSIVENLRYARIHRGKINHITGDAHYIALATGRNTLLTVHDVGSALNGGLFKQMLIKLLWFYLPALIVKRITVISQATFNELVGLVPFAKNKIVIIHNPLNADLSFSPKKFDAQCPMILHIGTKENKNLERVIKAISTIHCKMAILGKLTNNQVELLEACSIRYDNYYDLEYGKVIELYNSSDIISFPSMYEGFGMPLIEANAIGRPVLAGDIPVLHEVAPDSALFVDPYSEDAIRSGLVKLINDNSLRERLIRNGLENAKRFLPQNIAQQYNKIYETIA